MPLFASVVPRPLAGGGSRKPGRRTLPPPSRCQRKPVKKTSRENDRVDPLGTSETNITTKLTVTAVVTATALIGGGGMIQWLVFELH